MWRCPNCGTQIEPEFEVCWKCGTCQDGTRAEGFQAEPSDPAVPDLGPDPEPPKESAADAAAARARNERIAELCSTANIVEAHEIGNLLEEAGIQAQVVGDFLGAAPGSLPLGQSTAPRIWVHESDVIRAREVLAERFAESGTEFADWPETDNRAECEAAGEPEEAGELPSDRRFRFLSQGFWILGLACVVVGSVWAWQNGAILSKHSATADARLLGSSLGQAEIVRWPGIPIPDQPTAGPSQLVFHKNAEYAYVVGHTTYYATIENVENAPDHVAIYYDPDHPAKHIVGSIAPPWVVLAFAFGLGAFLMFVGYQFR
jgi:hypothetical protein